MSIYLKYSLTMLVSLSLAAGALAHENQPQNALSANGMVKTLKKITANSKPSFGKGAILDAAEKGNLKRTQELLRYNADFSVTDHQGRNPLMLAIENKHADVARLLLSDGLASPKILNQQDSYGNTPLMYAVIFNLPEFILPMVKAGANTEIKNEIGWTPLAQSVAGNNLEAFHTLLMAGADTQTVDSKGNTLLMSAINVNSGAIVQELLHSSRRPDITAVNAYKDNAFSLAVAKKDWKLAVQILNEVADNPEKLDQLLRPLESDNLLASVKANYPEHFKEFPRQVQDLFPDED